MEAFTIAPADTKALWLIGLVPLLVLVLVVAVLGASIKGSARLSLTDSSRHSTR